ncbi:L-rhodinosyltransferase/L-2-deoxyfucosyltransferase [Tamaricihabitans halophyticus]|uniref:L-rhodinosyltransferase/L-2-deoxyfucosyltransferase n=1 Tax=Tamaricihabitans halophyticus TaxID=1262583 RepID=A0A4R2QW15_9PSEU|nr:nucleotide disphospho-sugar-binding domain-containing protein [Tamaricihabitans halophyticus]TCP53444.1 L-rhodinosyltransferase/L-2-deoxyfucosyltransferase [Tamaricihabitans halophyticus]
MRVQIVPMMVPAHIALLVPLGWAMQNAGHDVRVLVPPDAVDTVGRSGLTAVPYGNPVNLAMAETGMHNVDSAMPWMAKINGMDSDGSFHDVDLRNLILSPLVMFYGAEELRPTLDDLIDKTIAWQPDLVMWDSVAAFASVLARVSGAANARMLWGFDHMARMRKAFLARAEHEEARDSIGVLAESVLARYGKEYDDSVLLGDFTVNPVPLLGQSSFDIPTVAVRQPAYANPTEVPDWVLEPPARPRICLTTGRSRRDVGQTDNYGISIQALFDGVAELDIDVVATFTAEQLPADIEVPDNVRLVDYVPFNVLLPTCSAVVHHSGGTTMMMAMWNAVPQIVISPKAWGDPDLTELTVEQGAGLAIPADELTGDKLSAALTRVLDEPSFARNATKMRSATKSLPNPNEAVPIIERLTEETLARHASRERSRPHSATG